MKPNQALKIDLLYQKKRDDLNRKKKIEPDNILNVNNIITNDNNELDGIVKMNEKLYNETYGDYYKKEFDNNFSKLNKSEIRNNSNELISKLNRIVENGISIQIVNKLKEINIPSIKILNFFFPEFQKIVSKYKKLNLSEFFALIIEFVDKKQRRNTRDENMNNPQNKPPNNPFFKNENEDIQYNQDEQYYQSNNQSNNNLNENNQIINPINNDNIDMNQMDIENNQMVIPNNQIDIENNQIDNIQNDYIPNDNNLYQNNQFDNQINDNNPLMAYQLNNENFEINNDNNLISYQLEVIELLKKENENLMKVITNTDNEYKSLIQTNNSLNQNNDILSTDLKKMKNQNKLSKLSNLSKFVKLYENNNKNFFFNLLKDKNTKYKITELTKINDKIKKDKLLKDSEYNKLSLDEQNLKNQIIEYNTKILSNETLINKLNTENDNNLNNYNKLVIITDDDKKQLNELKIENEHLKEERKNITNQLTLLNSEIKNIKNIKIQYENDINDLKQEMINFNSNLNIITLENNEKINYYNKEILEKNQMINEINEINESFQSQIQDINNLNQKKINENNESIASLQKNITDIKDDKFNNENKLNKQISDLQIKNKSLNEEISKNNIINIKLISEKDVKISSIIQEVSTLENKVNQLIVENNTSQNNLLEKDNIIEDKLSTISKLNGINQGLNSKVIILNKKIDEQNELNEKLKNETNNKTLEIDNYIKKNNELTTNYNRIKYELDTKQDELLDLQKELFENNFSNIKNDDDKLKIKEQNEKIINDNKNNLEKIKKEYEQQINENNKEIENLTKINEKNEKNIINIDNKNNKKIIKMTDKLKKYTSDIQINEKQIFELNRDILIIKEENQNLLNENFKIKNTMNQLSSENTIIQQSLNNKTNEINNLINNRDIFQKTLLDKQNEINILKENNNFILEDNERLKKTNENEYTELLFKYDQNNKDLNEKLNIVNNLTEKLNLKNKDFDDLLEQKKIITTDLLEQKNVILNINNKLLLNEQQYKDQYDNQLVLYNNNINNMTNEYNQIIQNYNNELLIQNQINQNKDYEIKQIQQQSRLYIKEEKSSISTAIIINYQEKMVELIRNKQSLQEEISKQNFEISIEFSANKHITNLLGITDELNNLGNQVNNQIKQNENGNINNFILKKLSSIDFGNIEIEEIEKQIKSIISEAKISLNYKKSVLINKYIFKKDFLSEEQNDLFKSDYYINNKIVLKHELITNDFFLDYFILNNNFNNEKYLVKNVIEQKLETSMVIYKPNKDNTLMIEENEQNVIPKNNEIKVLLEDVKYIEKKKNIIQKIQNVINITKENIKKGNEFNKGIITEADYIKNIGIINIYNDKIKKIENDIKDIEITILKQKNVNNKDIIKKTNKLTTLKNDLTTQKNEKDVLELQNSIHLINYYEKKRFEILGNKTVLDTLISNLSFFEKTMTKLNDYEIKSLFPTIEIDIDGIKDKDTITNDDIDMGIRKMETFIKSEEAKIIFDKKKEFLKNIPGNIQKILDNIFTKAAFPELSNIIKNKDNMEEENNIKKNYSNEFKNQELIRQILFYIIFDSANDFFKTINKKLLLESIETIYTQVYNDEDKFKTNNNITQQQILGKEEIDRSDGNSTVSNYKLGNNFNNLSDIQTNNTVLENALYNNQQIPNTVVNQKIKSKNESDITIKDKNEINKLKLEIKELKSNLVLSKKPEIKLEKRKNVEKDKIIDKIIDKKQKKDIDVLSQISGKTSISEKAMEAVKDYFKYKNKTRNNTKKENEKIQDIKNVINKDNINKNDIMDYINDLFKDETDNIKKEKLIKEINDMKMII